MPQRPAWMRLVAGILMIVQTQACASVWKSTQPLAPQDVVRGWKPPEVRVRLSDGKHLKVAQPRIVGDSLEGTIHTTKQHDPVAFAVAVKNIERLHVMKIPRVAERPRPSATGFVVLRGEPLRVTHMTPQGKRTVQGRFDRIIGDTLLVLDHGARRIALDSISRLKVRDGTKSNVLGGLIVGGSLAALCGVGMAAAASAPTRRAGPYYGGDETISGKGFAVFAFGVLGAGALVISTTVGGVTHHDRWDAVPLAWLTGRSADSTLRRP
jgi:hypothetical protein